MQRVCLSQLSTWPSIRANEFAEAGYKAVFLSVDVPVLGKRLNEYRNEFRIPEDMSYPNILSSGADVSDRTNYGMISYGRMQIQW